MKPTVPDLLFPVFMVIMTIWIGTMIGGFFSGCASIPDNDRYCRNQGGLKFGGRCNQPGKFIIKETK